MFAGFYNSMKWHSTFIATLFTAILFYAEQVTPASKLNVRLQVKKRGCPRFFYFFFSLCYTVTKVTFLPLNSAQSLQPIIE